MQYEIIISCWDDEPEERPTFDQTLADIDEFIKAFSSQEGPSGNEPKVSVEVSKVEQSVVEDKTAIVVRTKPTKPSPLSESFTPDKTLVAK